MALPIYDVVPKNVQYFVEGIHEVYKVVHHNLVHINSKYKQDVDKKYQAS